MTNGSLYLCPAYGRTYLTLELLKKAWESGEDFQVASGPYCSIRDLDTLKNDYDKVTIVYTGCEDLIVHHTAKSVLQGRQHNWQCTGLLNQQVRDRCPGVPPILTKHFGVANQVTGGLITQIA